ncbi:uncharacterized protein LOC112682716 [Sipha flava]|nr:uncharacterized protein LOC112682716 [Sipha flava]
MGTGDDGRTTVVRLTLSGLAFVSSAAAACCFLTVWSYWYRELDADCADAYDCTCLLFGSSLANGFVGGDRSVCRYVFYSMAASAALAAYASAYYGCKSLLCRRTGHRPVPSARPPETSPQITGSTVCLTIILVLMALNMLITSIVLSNGYISTCSQYVHRVKSFLMVTGNMVELVSNRMSCATIYDFMDYLQPPSQQLTYELLHRHKINPRDNIINTSTLLITSILLSWLNTSVWIIFIFFIYFFRYRNKN